MKPRRFPLLELVWALACLPACTVPRTALPPQAIEPRSLATDPTAQATDPRPFPAIEAGMHTAIITRIAVDAAGRYAVTASLDKTARVWELSTGKLLQVLRLPVGEDNEGKLYAVALSLDGHLVAPGGFTGPEGSADIYLFDRASGRMVGRIGGLPNVVNHLAFSPNGERLAAAAALDGIRLYAAQAPWRELGRDVDYGDSSYSEFRPPRPRGGHEPGWQAAALRSRPAPPRRTTLSTGGESAFLRSLFPRRPPHRRGLYGQHGGERGLR